MPSNSAPVLRRSGLPKGGLHPGGSEPTDSSSVYTTPFTIMKTTTIRAKSFFDGYLSSRSATQSYIYLKRDMTLPVISLVTDQRYWDDPQLGIITRASN